MVLGLSYDCSTFERQFFSSSRFWFAELCHTCWLTCNEIDDFEMRSWNSIEFHLLNFQVSWWTFPVVNVDCQRLRQHNSRIVIEAFSGQHLCHLGSRKANQKAEVKTNSSEPKYRMERERSNQNVYVLRLRSVCVCVRKSNLKMIPGINHCFIAILS